MQINRSYKLEDEEELVKNHTPLVISIAFRFKPKPPNDHDDLISIGMIGLLKAIRTFDASRGNQFSTLASKIIKREIIRELNRSSSRETESLNIDIERLEEENINEYLLDCLTETEKKILFYRFHYGFTYDEIGNKFKKTKQWANIKLKQILTKIEQDINDSKKKNTLGK